MNTSKLKAIFTTACCFVFALCSEIKSMDTASGIQELQETTSYKTKNTNSEGCLDSLKTEVSSNSSSALLLLNQDENKAPETSWGSYISSPIKSVINGTYNIVDFSVKHPTQTIITSLLITAQFTAVAADCNCIYIGGQPQVPYTLGIFPNETACQGVTAGGGTSAFYVGCY